MPNWCRGSKSLWLVDCEIGSFRVEQLQSLSGPTTWPTLSRRTLGRSHSAIVVSTLVSDRCRVSTNDIPAIAMTFCFTKHSEPSDQEVFLQHEMCKAVDHERMRVAILGCPTSLSKSEATSTFRHTQKRWSLATRVRIPSWSPNSALTSVQACTSHQASLF